MDEKQKIAARIAALQDKTVENGATEAEAVSAAEKVAELVSKYQIELGSVHIRKEGTTLLETPILMTSSGVKLHKGLKVKRHLCGSVAKYTDCKVWGSGDNIKVLGLPSDVEFFMWLIDSLSMFTIQQTKQYMTTCTLYGSGPRWQAQKAFSLGCANRIIRRLSDAKTERVVESTGRELIVVKNQLVTEAFAKLQLNLRRSGGRRTINDGSAYGAGQRAGENAGFGRPVNGGNGTKLLG